MFALFRKQAVSHQPTWKAYRGYYHLQASSRRRAQVEISTQAGNLARNRNAVWLLPRPKGVKYQYRPQFRGALQTDQGGRCAPGDGAPVPPRSDHQVFCLNAAATQARLVQVPGLE